MANNRRAGNRGNNNNQQTTNTQPTNANANANAQPANANANAQPANANANAQPANANANAQPVGRLASLSAFMNAHRILSFIVVTSILYLMWAIVVGIFGYLFHSAETQRFGNDAYKNLTGETWEEKQNRLQRVRITDSNEIVKQVYNEMVALGYSEVTNDIIDEYLTKEKYEFDFGVLVRVRQKVNTLLATKEKPLTTQQPVNVQVTVNNNINTEKPEVVVKKESKLMQAADTEAQKFLFARYELEIKADASFKVKRSWVNAQFRLPEASDFSRTDKKVAYSKLRRLTK